MAEMVIAALQREAENLGLRLLFQNHKLDCYALCARPYVKGESTEVVSVSKACPTMVEAGRHALNLAIEHLKTECK